MQYSTHGPNGLLKQLPRYKPSDAYCMIGITNEDHVVIYDDSDVISSCRCWYMFIYFGHDIKKISVLDGGLRKWKKESKELTNKLIKFKKSEIGRAHV